MRRSVERHSYYYGSDNCYKMNIDEYDLIPILEVPLLFLYQENESLMEVAWRIYQRLVSPFVADKEVVQNTLIQWEEKCHQKAIEMEKEQEKEWKRLEEEKLRREEEDQRRRESWLKRNDHPPVTSPFTHVQITSKWKDTLIRP